MLVGTAAPARAAGLTSAQVQAILSLLSSFGADQSTINNVQISLNGGTSTGGGTQSFCHTFIIDLKLGDGYGATTAPNNQSAFQREIYYLQTALAKTGFSIDSNETTDNSFRDSTNAAVIKFQAKYGIRQTGYIGPLTRAKLNALYGCLNQSSQPVTSVANWNSYQNGQYGFALQYPNDWTHSSDVASKSFGRMFTIDSTNRFACYFNVAVVTNPNYVKEAYNNFTQTNVTIGNGISALQIGGLSGSTNYGKYFIQGSGQGNSFEINETIEKFTNNVAPSSVSANDAQNCVSTFSKILSTFKRYP